VYLRYLTNTLRVFKFAHSGLYSAVQPVMGGISLQSNPGFTVGLPQ